MPWDGKAKANMPSPTHTTHMHTHSLPLVRNKRDEIRDMRTEEVVLYLTWAKQKRWSWKYECWAAGPEDVNAEVVPLLAISCIV